MAGASEDVDNELNGLQKRYRIVEGDRKAYSEDSSNLLRRQRATIDKLKGDNAQLKEELSAERKHMTATVNLVYADVSRVREIVNRKTQKVDRVAMVTALVQDQRRNALVVDEVARCARSGRKILVLSERRQHLSDIQDMLATRGVRAGRLPRDV